MRAEFSKRWVCERGGGAHIKETLWIIATLRQPFRSPPPLGRAGWASSAGPGAGAGEFAFGLVPAFVDALQAPGHDGLQLADLALFVGFFGIHRSGAMT